MTEAGKREPNSLQVNEGARKARQTQISYNPAHGHRTDTARDPTPHSPTAPHRRTTTRGAHARLSAALLRAHMQCFRGSLATALDAGADCLWAGPAPRPLYEPGESPTGRVTGTSLRGRSDRERAAANRSHRSAYSLAASLPDQPGIRLRGSGEGWARAFFPRPMNPSPLV